MGEFFNMSAIQTIIFAIIQGISELFPISSVAHGGSHEWQPTNEDIVACKKSSTLWI
jgi:hypothetical protein